MRVSRRFSITGTSFHRGSWDVLSRLRAGTQLIPVRDPTNKYDANAVKIMYGQRMLGHMPRGLAIEIAPVMDAGIEVLVAKSKDPSPGVLVFAYEQKEVPDGEPTTA